MITEKEKEYWERVKCRFNELKNNFNKRYEESIDTTFLKETRIKEIRRLWEFTNYRIGNDGQGYPIYGGGRLRFAVNDLIDGLRDYDNEDHLEADSYLTFEKWLEIDYVGSDNDPLKNSVKDEIRTVSHTEINNIPLYLKKYLISENLDSFFKVLQTIFAGLPYSINKSKEGYFHSNIHLLLSVIGFDIQSEFTTNIGRIDLVIQLEKLIYIMEFKIGKKPETAIKQIIDKKYCQRFQNTGKKIIAVGVSCCEKERNIVSWTFKTIE